MARELRGQIVKLTHSGTSYFPHMAQALRFSLRCQVWGLRAAIHAFSPSLFPTTSVQMVKEITEGGEGYVLFDESLGDA